MLAGFSGSPCVVLSVLWERPHHGCPFDGHTAGPHSRTGLRSSKGRPRGRAAKQVDGDSQRQPCKRPPCATTTPWWLVLGAKHPDPPRQWRNLNQVQVGMTTFAAACGLAAQRILVLSSRFSCSSWRCVSTFSPVDGTVAPCLLYSLQFHITPTSRTRVKAGCGMPQ